jgi:hypothetical protein
MPLASFFIGIEILARYSWLAVAGASIPIM